MSPAAPIQVLYFAGLREALGLAQESLELPAGVSTTSQLRAWLCQRGGVWEQQLAPGRSVRVAVNHEMVQSDTEIPRGAEVAFFPPVTGG